MKVLGQGADYRSALSVLALCLFVVVTEANSQSTLKSRRARAELAMQHLREQMDLFQAAYHVYTNAGAPENHFLVPAAMGSDLTLIPGTTKFAATDIDMCASEMPHSEPTAIKSTFRKTDGRNWAGWYLLRNYEIGPDGKSYILEKDQPKPDWATLEEGGADLKRPKELSFWARGEKGGEIVEFFVGGVGWVAETRKKDPNFPFRDSAMRTPRLREKVTELTKDWTRYTIPLGGVNLSRISGGFGWALAADYNPHGAVVWIDDIKYEYGPDAKTRPDNPRFIRSFVPRDQNRTDFDRVFADVAFTYDNAIAMLAFMAYGDKKDWARAKLIADAFVAAETHDRFYADGRLRNAYRIGDVLLPPGWLSNGKAQAARVPGRWDCSSGNYFEDRYQVSTHTGNVAWAAIALLTYYEKMGGKEYRDSATRMAQWIAKQKGDGTLGGYLGGFEGWEESLETKRWISSEHNLDIYVAFKKLARITKESQWNVLADHAERFVSAMSERSRFPGCFLTGSHNSEEVNEEVVPLDVQAWVVLALPNAIDRYPAVLKCAEEYHLTRDGDMVGFDFNDDINTPNDGIWFEGTAQMAVAYNAIGEKADAEKFIQQLRRAQTEPKPNRNGRGIVAASVDGLTTGFSQIDGGPPLLYYDRLHIGATAWYVFAELGVNPYALP